MSCFDSDVSFQHSHTFKKRIFSETHAESSKNQVNEIAKLIKGVNDDEKLIAALKVIVDEVFSSDLEMVPQEETNAISLSWNKDVYEQLPKISTLYSAMPMV